MTVHSSPSLTRLGQMSIYTFSSSGMHLANYNATRNWHRVQHSGTHVIDQVMAPFYYSFLFYLTLVKTYHSCRKATEGMNLPENILVQINDRWKVRVRAKQEKGTKVIGNSVTVGLVRALLTK